MRCNLIEYYISQCVFKPLKTNGMKFTEEKARTLQAKFSRPRSGHRTTIINWRRSGRIPDAYADPSFRPWRNQKPAKPELEKRILNLLSIPGLNRRGFSSVSDQKIINLRNGKVSGLHTPEATGVLRELKELREKARRILESDSLIDWQAFLADPRIKPYPLIKNASLTQRLKWGRKLSEADWRVLTGRMVEFSERLEE